MAHLTLVLQGREVRKFVLNSGVTTIGRAQDNDIVINNLALSRRHAQVEQRSGHFEVSDLGSQNGVYVNSDRLRGPRILSNADTITLGTYHFVFADGSDPEVAVPATRSGRPSPPEDKPVSPPAPREAPAASPVEDGEHVPLIVLKYNDVELQRFPLRNPRCIIGRAKDCDVQIAERRLSRKHCEVAREGDGFIVRDLGSQNGTYVNRRRVKDSHPLSDGDVLNFAEYSVLFLADVAEYDGPDLVHARRQAAHARGGRPDSQIGSEETAFPEAYEDREPGFDPSNAPSIVPEDERGRLRPRDLDDDEGEDGDRARKPPIQMMPPGAPTAPNGRSARPAARPSSDDQEPFIEPPASSRERRKQPTRAARDPRPAPARREMEPEELTQRPRGRVEQRRPQGPNDVSVRPAPKDARASQAEIKAEPRGDARKPPPKEPTRPRRDPEDVPDDVGDVRPAEELEDWYQARNEKSEVFEDEDSSVLLRGKSSVSQVLSTMMVDKRELDKNLSVRARQRKFVVDVRHSDQKIYNGPLHQQVTILGTDKEADIQLKGRYVAGRHSILVRVRDSLLLVRLGSSSAARVNGLPKLQAFLKTGDVVQIDETTIRITEE